MLYYLCLGCGLRGLPQLSVCLSESCCRPRPGLGKYVQVLRARRIRCASIRGERDFHKGSGLLRRALRFWVRLRKADEVIPMVMSRRVFALDGEPRVFNLVER